MGALSRPLHFQTFSTRSAANHKINTTLTTRRRH